MTQQNPFEYSTAMYETWMKQSKEFFDTAEKSLKQVFSKDAYHHQQDYFEQIRQWQEKLKNDWQRLFLQQQQKATEEYWKWMMKMCNEASDKMVQEWMKRAKNNDPVKNAHELYELWLNCCHEIYQQSTNTASYQKAYGDMMNSAMEFWKATLRK